MTNWDRRELNVSLDFLGKGPYRATIWRDADNADQDAERLVKESIFVTNQDRLLLKLAPGGGAVVRFEPRASRSGS